MKKSLVLAMAMALGVTASAYAANPFSDVPAGHWAYRRQPLSRSAPAAVAGSARRTQGHRRRPYLHRQRQRRGDRSGLPHLLPAGHRQRGLDRTDLRHVPRRGGRQRRRTARSAARRRLLAAGRTAARGGGRTEQTAVALLTQQPHGQRLSGDGDRTAAAPLRRHGRPRRSLRRFRRRGRIPAAARRIPEPDRAANALQGVGHGGTAHRAGLRGTRGRSAFFARQISL